MKTTTKKIALFIAASLTTLGCPSDDDTSSDTNNDTSSESGGPTTTASTTTMSTTTNPSTTETTTTATTADTTADSSSTTPDETSSSSSSGDPSAFEFLPNGPEDYVQVDRKGFPAVNTGLNLLGDKDAYNNASPVDDANGDFVQQALDSLVALHIGVEGMQVPDDTGLDDELALLSLMPCNPPGEVGNPDCEDQALPFVLPDTLTIDTDDAAGFPNGRGLEDQAIDIVLAVLMLNLNIHSATTFADAGIVNPVANDVDFPAEFPFLAPAN